MISFIVKIIILSGNIKKNKTILRESIRGSKKYLDRCRNKVREIVTRDMPNMKLQIYGI